MLSKSIYNQTPFYHSLFSVMAYYIDEAKVIEKGKINYETIAEAATNLKLIVAVNPFNRPPDWVFKTWAEALIDNYNLGPRTLTISENGQKIAITWPKLLENAYDFWKNTSIPESKQSVAVHHILKYIDKGNVNKKYCDVPSFSDLASAANLAGIKTSWEKNFVYQKYYLWGEHLINYFGWRPAAYDLRTLLSAAHSDWINSQKKTKITSSWPSTIQNDEAKKPVESAVIKKTTSKVTKGFVMSSFAEVNINEVDIDGQGSQLSSGTYMSSRCDFCNKESSLENRKLATLQRLSNDKQFFCVFCTRHDFNTKKRKHVFAFSMRAIIAYIYYFNYNVRNPTLYITEINDLINLHVAIGLQNPVFVYDHETYNWYVDFSKVGRNGKKIPLPEVIHTVFEMISAFNPYDHIKEFKSDKFTAKFIEAITDFYTQRYRPTDKRICVPTLLHCASDSIAFQNTNNVTQYKKLDLSTLRDFSPHQLVASTRR